MVNRRCGLVGVSEISGDVRDLLAREAKEVPAAEAIALFCYEIKKWIGAYAAALGGLDTLVFAGGIGENSTEVRARVCDGLDFLGVRLDDGRNARCAGGNVRTTGSGHLRGGQPRDSPRHPYERRVDDRQGNESRRQCIRHTPCADFHRHTECAAYIKEPIKWTNRSLPTCSKR